MTALSLLSFNTDKDFVHNTIHVYEALLHPIRHRVQNVLEVGINAGNSHRMWRDYFLNATIYGIDVEDNCNGMADEDRIIAMFDDAYSHEMVQNLSDIVFDVIIDDGPHTLESQCFLVHNYPKLLAANGILIVEDIPDITWIEDLTRSAPKELQQYCYGIDRRSSAPNSWFHDEILFVIDKRFT